MDWEIQVKGEETMSIGVIVNILTVVIGGILGAVAGKWLSRDFADRLTFVFGVCAMGMGISSINITY